MSKLPFPESAAKTKVMAKTMNRVTLKVEKLVDFDLSSLAASLN